MGYSFDSKMNRFAGRSDLSTNLVHLTKERDSASAMDVLFEILETGYIKGSNSSGFINGSTPAVCFQDVPLTAVCQNCWYEQKYLEKKHKKDRYEPIGFLVRKEEVYNQKGRPVIYDNVSEAKKYLKTEDYWRIVNLDLSDNNNIIDWTHEREWRVPHKFDLSLSDTILLFTNEGCTRDFISRCEEKGVTWHRDVAGIVTLSALLF
jgi:NADH:ubiquinone oxidoreductase subunit